MTYPYPGLDGHPRRIVPPPVSIPISPIKTPSELLKQFREQDAREEKEIFARVAKMKEERSIGTETESGDNEDKDRSSATNRSTIGNTYIPPEEE